MAETGTLSAQTFVAGMAVPLENVSVTVTAPDGEHSELIAFRTTDEDGLTDAIPLTAPELQLSLAPTEERPFATINVQFDHPSYYTALVRNAQIFPGERSIQMMEMLPLEENAPEDERGFSYTVTPQNL